MPITCSRAGPLIHRFLAGGLDRKDQIVLREHLAGCTDCDEDYRSGVAATAMIGREHAAARRDLAGATARARREQGLPVDGSRSGGQRVRLLAYPALLALLLWAFGSRALGAGGARVEVLAGEVVASSAVLEGGSARVGRGDWVATLVDARATLSVGTFELTLSPGTRVLIERTSPPRVRVESGVVEAFGAAELVTPGNLIVSTDDSAVRLEVDGGVSRVRCLRGSVRCLDASGEQVLGAGAALP